MAGTSDHIVLRVMRCLRVEGHPSAVESLKKDLVLARRLVRPREPDLAAVPREVGTNRLSVRHGHATRPIVDLSVHVGLAADKKVDLVVAIAHVVPRQRDSSLIANLQVRILRLRPIVFRQTREVGT